MTSDNVEGESDGFTRRTYLLGIGGAGLAGTAGCLGDGDGNGDASNDAGNDDSGSGTNDADFPEYDSELEPGDGDEYVEMFPQPAEEMYELGNYQADKQGLLEPLEDPRDEPRYGDELWEVDDESEYISPDPIEMTFVPDEDPAALERAMEPLMDQIEEYTGHSVNYVPVDSYAATVEAMRAGRLHFGRVSGGTMPYAANIAGAHPIAHIMEDDEYGNAFWMVTRRDNDEINTVADLEGIEVTHADPGSGSGNLEPRVFIEDDAGLVAEEDYDVDFSGGHDTSLRGIEQGDYEVGPCGGPTFANMVEQGQIDPENFKVIYMGPVMPRGPMSYVYNLEPDLVEGITKALLEHDYSGTAMEEELQYNNFIEVDYYTTYDPILQVHEALGEEYDIDEMDG
ncbi:phosphate/phosphite/phosphonate ABC transporter substrate-binding protein [Natronococcus sp. A-GB7]|uniref:phosphate/phosphite/phosphonate ABC transporter substrate-binding protein n=1 Tax=Natronococcus sp. A-GB7 TaxID=3037649 RepID=UPI00241CAAD2|nr:phosphate/phosphite/phosphonate ABC transporter substrate-binding protein [Natronococcus sp. A-GB7]MDG5818246.1 phosphate/phosphite/phosphonate ABC transporter substrate-binding protein [Natronococcus sp. A-GB7]